mgnify:CR=1 FL=1
MFAEKAYSPHGVLLITATIFCVVSGAILLSSAGVKLYKKPLYWLAASSLFILIIFAAVRYMLLIAPTHIVFQAIIKLQTIAGIMAACVPFLVLIFLIIRKHSASIVFGMAVIAITNTAGIVVVLRTDPVSITDFFSSGSFVLFCGYYLLCTKKLFPELAAAPEALLKESNDLILVFDARRRLMKASPNCAELFRIRDNMTLEEFEDILNEISTIREDKIVSLAASSGVKYYQFSETSVKTRSGTPLATVLMFSDVTEITELKAQLSGKNEELGALNAQLETYIKTSEKLETEEQKEMAVRELEQAIGQKIEELTCGIEASDALQNLPRLIEACRDIMAGVRQTVSRLTKTEEGELKR